MYVKVQQQPKFHCGIYVMKFTEYWNDKKIMGKIESIISFFLQPFICMVSGILVNQDHGIFITKHMECWDDETLNCHILVIPFSHPSI
jgi:hypothetical protein